MTGTQLRDQREAMGLSIESLAARAGVAASTISRAERGEVALRPRTERQLALVLRGGTGEDAASQVGEVTAILLHAGREQRAAILQFARFVLQEHFGRGHEAGAALAAR